MKFSIVVPSYNHAAYLEDALKSILSQGVDAEIILMDGGSKDGTTNIIEKYRPQLAYAVSEKDGGQTAALITGFTKTSGEIMGWLNSDDYYYPDALKAVADFFRANPDVDVVYGDMNWVSVGGAIEKEQKEIDFSLPILLWVYNYIPQPSTFWRRSAWEKVQGLNPTRQCAMDCDLWFQFVKAGCTFKHLPKTLSAMRRYPEQKNQRLRTISDAEDLEIREVFLGRKISKPERFIKKCIWKVIRQAEKIAAHPLAGCGFFG